MLKKIAILFGIAALCFGTVYGLESRRAIEADVPCRCCGTTCDCDDCKCDELNCACDTGGDCECSGDCCKSCCEK